MVRPGFGQRGGQRMPPGFGPGERWEWEMGVPDEAEQWLTPIASDLFW